MRPFAYTLFFAAVAVWTGQSAMADGSNSRVKDEVRHETWIKALAQFDSANSPEEFRDAGKTLESISFDGYSNGAVFYNLGNIYFRAGDFGKAILNYRKAKHFRPRDPYLEANLQQALLLAPGRITASPKPWWLHVMFWHNFVAYSTRVWIAILLLGLAPLVLLVAVTIRKNRLIGLALAIALIGLAFCADSFLNSPARLLASYAVITGETIARKGIDKDYEPAFDQPVRDGAEFQVLDETNGWTLGHFEGIGDGWVKNEFVGR